MKSEKAKEYLSRTAMSPNSPLAQDEGFVWGDTSVIEAVERAEQEAEERMREKAVKAYCYDCSCTVIGICEISADNCLALQGFIQKLNEE